MLRTMGRRPARKRVNHYLRRASDLHPHYHGYCNSLNVLARRQEVNIFPFYYCSCEDAGSIGASIDAYAIGPPINTVANSVAMDHHAAMIMCIGQERLADPTEVAGCCSSIGTPGRIPA